MSLTHKKGFSQNRLQSRRAIPTVRESKYIILVLSELPGGHLFWPANNYKIFSPNEHSALGWGRPGAHYEILANHMTWNETFIETTLPKATKVTILRNPTTLLASSWKYYYISIDKAKNKVTTADQKERNLNELLQEKIFNSQKVGQAAFECK